MVILIDLISFQLGALVHRGECQIQKETTTRTKVVLLGTVTPVPAPDRPGPSTAIVADNRAYLFDIGPGVVRRCESAALNRKIPAVEPGQSEVRLIFGQSHSNSPFSKSKDTLWNPIFANPKRPSKSFRGSESISAIATLRAPRLSLPRKTPVRNHRT